MVVKQYESEQLVSARETLMQVVGSHVRVGWYFDETHRFALKAYDERGGDILAAFDFGFDDARWEGDTLVLPVEVAQHYEQQRFEQNND